MVVESANLVAKGVVEWWRVDIFAYITQISHHRGTYYANTPWKDHPWAKQFDRDGVDFVDIWAIEEEVRGEWRSTGRSGTAFMLHLFDPEKNSNTFFSYEDALKAACERLSRHINYLVEESHRYSSLLQDFNKKLGAVREQKYHVGKQ